MTEDELSKILRLHALWLQEKPEGKRADLRGTNLNGADLGGANLNGAYLGGAYLSGAKLPHFQICPEEGGFYAWKKVRGGVCKLYIPAAAKRTSSLVGRKCRAEYVKVISAPEDARGRHDPKMVYTVGQIVRPDYYDPDIRIECAHGIHFFMTKREAEEY